MKAHLPILILLVLIAALIFPVTAVLTPNTFSGTPSSYNSTSFTHDVNYLPVEFVYAFIILGFFTMIVSQAIIKYGILYSVLSPVAFGLATWYSNYMTQESVNAVYSCLLEEPIVVHTQIITPSPAFTIFLIMCFLISIINLLIIYFLSREEKEKINPKLANLEHESGDE
jgi:multidrug transporter EmrE-like cation transporter